VDNPRPAGIMSVARSVFRTNLISGSPNFLNSRVHVGCIVCSAIRILSDLCQCYPNDTIERVVW
jgi:hypothetical protein